MKPWKSADYFLKVNFHAVDMEQGESKPSPDFNLKVFFLKNLFITKTLTDFSEYGARRLQTVFQISIVETGMNPCLLSCRTAYRPQWNLFKWNRSGNHCNTVGYHRKSWSSAFFWMFKRHMSSYKASNVWITWYRVINRTQTLLNTVQLWQLNRQIKRTNAGLEIIFG